MKKTYKILLVILTIFTSLNIFSSTLLQNGRWVKISTKESAIYKISFSKLQDLGFTDPSNIKLYGNGGSHLNMLNEGESPEELKQLPTFVENNFVYFFLEGITPLNYDNLKNAITHKTNTFATEICYLLSDQGDVKSIDKEQSYGETPIEKSFATGVQFREKDLNITNKSGRDWYSEIFNSSLTFKFEHTLDNVDLSKQIKIITRLMHKSMEDGKFFIKTNQNNEQTINISGGYSGASIRIKESVDNLTIDNKVIILSLTYDQKDKTQYGILDYYIINYKRNLIFNSTELHFFELERSSIVEYKIEGSTASTSFWKINSIENINSLNQRDSNGTVYLKTKPNIGSHFVCFNKDICKEPNIVGEVANTNLFGTNKVEMLIITLPIFREHADRLAKFRTDTSKIPTKVVECEDIYNAFCGGTKDITAIRNYLRKFRLEKPEIKYVLLFGDATYDYRKILLGKLDYVPTYQTVNSTSEINSYVSDDYFVLLDRGEGENFNGKLTGHIDLSIGRLPIETPEDAETVVKKIIDYTLNPGGEWISKITLIADDEDSNIHIKQAETLSKIISDNNSAYEKERIYLDKYNEITSGAQASYPEANLEIQNCINNGTLLINYVGHSNSAGLAHENIFTIDEIKDLKNKKLPIFITASCEFSRFDKFSTKSSGELMLLNPDGGAIALITTTRIAFSYSNHQINKEIYKYLFKYADETSDYRLGDVVRLAKQFTNLDYKRSFILLGDPSVKLNLPQNRVVTNLINEKNADLYNDTLSAFETVNIKASVILDNKLNTNFDGIINVSIYDKPNKVITKGNNSNTPFEFEEESSIIYKGKVSVKEGAIDFSFIVPKDINYQLGKGVIKYISINNTHSAMGYCNKIVIGGTSESELNDFEGPEISMFINNVEFKDGNTIGPTSLLIANLEDESGINTLSNGINHNIKLTLDDDIELDLSNYYRADTNTYKSGKLYYTLNNISEGHHNLSLEVWDVSGNFTDKNIEFVVANSKSLIIENITSYPNPVTNNTTIVFDHNQISENVTALVRIFSMNGRLVYQEEKNIDNNFASKDAIDLDISKWSTKSTGYYTCQIEFKLSNGTKTTKNLKLIIVDY